MTFKKGDKVFVEFEVLDTCHSSDYMLVKDKSNQTRQFLKSEAQAMPKKVVIPKFVAEWIEVCKEHLPLNISSAMDSWVLGDHNQPSDLIQWMKKSKNKEVFARAWLDGYEIEQEQRYTVEVPNPNSTSKNTLALRKLFTGIEICRVNAKTYKTDKHCQLTEAEIKQDFEWAWKWAEPAGGE